MPGFVSSSFDIEEIFHVHVLVIWLVARRTHKRELWPSNCCSRIYEYRESLLEKDWFSTVTRRNWNLLLRMRGGEWNGGIEGWQTPPTLNDFFTVGCVMFFNLHFVCFVWDFHLNFPSLPYLAKRKLAKWNSGPLCSIALLQERGKFKPGRK